MTKKRGKTKPKVTSKKKVKKVQTKEKAAEKIEAPKPIKDTLRELEILAEEKKEEAYIVNQEKKIEKETEKVQKLEKEIKKEVTIKPLTKFNRKDLNKGIIGAFIGVVAHFAFIYGKEIAQDISTSRATILIIFSYLLIIVLMYETGYREIKEKRLLGILPKRATIIYVTSIVIILVIFLLFNQINMSDITITYKQIAVTSILASLGAGTADLIGKD